MDEYEEFRTARGEWDKMESARGTMLSRMERMAQLTLPSVLPPTTYDTQQDQLTNGYTSLGGQAATHLTNKLMLAMFAPSRPFMRLDIALAEKAKLIAALGVTEDVLTEALSQGEQAAIKELEQGGQRQTLFEACTHLIVLGNGLLDLSGDTINFLTIREYVVKRTPNGTVGTLIIRQKYELHELEQDACKEYRQMYPNARWDQEVFVYTWVRLVGKKYRSSVWVDDVKLSPGHGGSWTPDSLPWRVLTWRLPARQHYGIGRVEEYANDLAEHEGMSKALSEGAALAAAFRWLASPTGLTRPEDIANAPNGGVIPGSKGDVDLLYANIGQQLATVQNIRADVARRIGQGFLMQSAVTRDAERVTAQEVRIQAMELEASYGGAYSRISMDVQKPLALWLLRKAAVDIKGTKIVPVIITGLDALSRNADLERMMQFLGNVAQLDTLSPSTKIRLRESNIVADMAAGAGVERGRYVATDEEVKAKQQEEQQSMMNQQAAMAGTEAGARNAMNQEVPQ